MDTSITAEVGVVSPACFGCRIAAVMSLIAKMAALAAERALRCDPE